MRNEKITNKEAICLLMIFILGSTYILGTGTESKQDAWISVIFGLFMSLPILIIFSRIMSLYPEKGLFEIIEETFGKVAGKVFILLYIWYSFHLGALVVRNFGEFINTVAMPETPKFVPMFCLVMVAIPAVKSGIEVLARTSAYLLPVILLIILIVQLLGFPLLDFNNIKPIFNNGWQLILKGGASTFAFPFAETVLFIGIFSSLKTKKSLYKVFLLGTAIAGFLLVIITLRNILILGPVETKFYFPAHVAVSRIRIGDYFERLELTVAVIFVVGVFIKLSICLLVACKGIAHLFHLDDYRSIVIQTGLLMLYFSYCLYYSIMEMGEWAFKVYFYYAFPFQVILPMIILVIGEIKQRRRRKQLSLN
ncbi:endospore germination permease [Neobacillus sp. PS3-12]|jgi:spore germination protein KB|uniref:GerAB/ArcD/ProY family transporter n=1 Tax=Neobacillus sp. PS3-12 TaxID=3070677 RepID=UPI0027DF2019|nr:endospore germination permease [Neobacillus sp. PS3-12]WML53027.1 endospore germination permease [Neobacillus sp. PS3-12]